MENKEPNIKFGGPESTMESGQTDTAHEMSEVQAASHGQQPQPTSAEPHVDFEDVKQRVLEARDRMKERVKDRALTLADERKENTAQTLSDVANALHCAADRLHEGHRDAMGNYAARAADRVEHFCSTLRSKDFPTLLHDAEDIARSRPGLFLGGAATLGFLAARFLKSTPVPAERHPPREQLYPDLERSQVPVEMSTQSPYTGGEAI